MISSNLDRFESFIDVEWKDLMEFLALSICHKTAVWEPFGKVGGRLQRIRRDVSKRSCSLNGCSTETEEKGRLTYYVFDLLVLDADPAKCPGSQRMKTGTSALMTDSGFRSPWSHAVIVKEKTTCCGARQRQSEPLERRFLEHKSLQLGLFASGRIRWLYLCLERSVFQNNLRDSCSL
jgi:hypothetical protein